MGGISKEGRQGTEQTKENLRYRVKEKEILFLELNFLQKGLTYLGVNKERCKGKII
jgi:hypothetical protein